MKRTVFLAIVLAGFVLAALSGVTLAQGPFGGNEGGYGMMGGGMMGGYWSASPAAKMTVTVEQARSNAAQFLKTFLPNATLEDSTDTFYGYYNMDVSANGKTYGMLSVNGYTGAVWYHAWHGEFIAAKDLE